MIRNSSSPRLTRRPAGTGAPVKVPETGAVTSSVPPGGTTTSPAMVVVAGTAVRFIASVLMPSRVSASAVTVTVVSSDSLTAPATFAGGVDAGGAGASRPQASRSIRQQHGRSRLSMFVTWRGGTRPALRSGARTRGEGCLPLRFPCARPSFSRRWLESRTGPRLPGRRARSWPILALRVGRMSSRARDFRVRVITCACASRTRAGRIAPPRISRGPAPVPRSRPDDAAWFRRRGRNRFHPGISNRPSLAVHVEQAPPAESSVLQPRRLPTAELELGGAGSPASMRACPSRGPPDRHGAARFADVDGGIADGASAAPTLVSCSRAAAQRQARPRASSDRRAGVDRRCLGLELACRPPRSLAPDLRNPVGDATRLLRNRHQTAPRRSHARACLGDDAPPSPRAARRPAPACTATRWPLESRLSATAGPELFGTPFKRATRGSEEARLRDLGARDAGSATPPGSTDCSRA